MILALSSLGAVLASGASGAEEFDKYALESASASLSNTQAGAHADFTTTLKFSRKPSGEAYAFTRDVIVELPPGMAGNPQAYPQCTALQFGTSPESNKCPQDSQIGSASFELAGQGEIKNEPIFNMPVPAGDVAARFGFYAGSTPLILNVRLNPKTNSLIAAVEGASNGAAVIAATTTFWGIPANPSHDLERLTVEEASKSLGPPPGGRKSNHPETPFMTNPTSCESGRTVRITARSYQLPMQPSTLEVPFPQITGCGALDFQPTTKLTLTTTQGTSGTGLDYELKFPMNGLESPNLLSGSHLKRAEVVLPEGVSINPSEAEGLGVCSPEAYEQERFDALPNEGCPETSKIGSVTATSPIVDRVAQGALYIAKPYDNPFGSLLALYMVLRIPDRGVLITLPGKVSLDPQTGQITTVFENLPQLPNSSFLLHFKEGARAPLVTPAACGSYDAVSRMTPWSAPESVVAKTNTISIESGPNHGPCPNGGLPPFKPGLIAGSQNNAAGTYSPFYLRLTRDDAEQEITHFSMKLPPGVTGKLAGIPFCPDGAVAAAKARTGSHGGEEELNAPSCPAASQIGTTIVGAGVGDVLAYVPGKVYLAGPYHGSPISIVAVTAAKAGPFDLGTVVVREALRVNPETAEVFVDATGSDPIPHIINGIPVRLRDIRVYVDRPGFMLNPTSCKPTSTASTLLGAGLDFVSEADDNPITVASRYQAADCAALGFKPRLTLRLSGGTKRNQVPALQAVVQARPGDANIAGTEVVLPHSEFLEQGHIRTVCTRVQFAAGGGNGAGCPAGSVYGHAKAITPLLSEPLEGPVFLRSNGGERALPDLVAALHGQEIDIDIVGYIDSVEEKNGRGEVVSGIRSRFLNIPDAPVTKFVLQMQGGKKGLLVNSTNICRGKHRAKVDFTAQNGRKVEFKQEVRAACGRHGHGKKKRANDQRGR
jgi:hypothetical protein